MRHHKASATCAEVASSRENRRYICTSTYYYLLPNTIACTCGTRKVPRLARTRRSTTRKLRHRFRRHPPRPPPQPQPQPRNHHRRHRHHHLLPPQDDLVLLLHSCPPRRTPPPPRQQCPFSSLINRSPPQLLTHSRLNLCSFNCFSLSLLLRG